MNRSKALWVSLLCINWSAVTVRATRHTSVSSSSELNFKLNYWRVYSSSGSEKWTETPLLPPEADSGLLLLSTSISSGELAVKDRLVSTCSLSEALMAFMQNEAIAE